MDTSSKGSRTRNWLAAGVIAIALAVGGYLVGLDSRPVPAPRPQEPASSPAVPPAAAQDAVLNRTALIRIVEAEADRFGGGVNARTSFTGRRFLVRIPFGCGGPGDGKARTGWSYDEDSETLRLRLTPDEWTDEGWLSQTVAAGAIEVIEGFWLPRPWTSSEQCPAKPVAVDAAKTEPGTSELPEAKSTEAGAAPVSPERNSSVALAQFFGSDSKRSDQRRGRPFEVVSKVTPEAVPARGLQLTIEGRIANIPGGVSNVLCHAPNPNIRPTCLVAVEFDRIAVSNPATQTELANWRL